MPLADPPTTVDEKSTAPFLSPQEKLELVDRVVNSSAFSRSPAMQAFLLYIAKHAIEKRPERIKEQSIGVEVLGRKSNYDPAQDNIVRVRAHELRQRLAKYFATDGIGERVVIIVPKGTYVPEFHAHPEVAPTPPAVHLVIPETGVLAEEQLHKNRQKHWLWPTVSAFALVAVAALIILLKSPNSQSRNTATAQMPEGAIGDFWGQFFVHPNDELRVVTADTGFGLWQDISGQNLNLGDYLSHKYLQNPDDKLREVAVRRATSPADVTISLKLSALARQFGGHINELYARDINTHTLQNGNIVVVGSHRSNPWIEVFESQLNFVVDRNKRTGAPFFRNKAPRPSETAIYSIPAMLDANGAEQKEIDSYGVIALVKECNGRKRAVLLEGLNMEATEATGEVVADPQLLGNLLHYIGHQPGTDVAPFEALIRVTSLPGGYANPEVIAYRVASGPSCMHW